ncbi:autotransporter secretion outer membrane protein TamA [Mariprofundus ferrinatatus]|uniref:Autotransporter secretion outer membrane protein TamA n=1 Tax=Mariprofundus ferrinatatus TaxID=1921087 RepID=A0A2K8L6Q4_9PROT|nr:BamA/TamA family outer membrane protein [Mariprofundus ferrinatatus]ATX82802.1 autotransporter secretion outer membrane protein TamA [Mariprofundus ferrinatatus]
MRLSSPRLSSLCVLLLAAALLFSSNAFANDARRIIGSPVGVPESLLKKMDTLQLKSTAGPALVRYMAAQDASVIRSWLRSEGYLDAEVTSVVEEGEARWRVQAGELWRVRHVEVLPAPVAKVALPESGDPFRSQDYDKAKTALRWAWRDAGYLRADYINAVVVPDRESRLVDISWQIKPGPLFYISELRVEGARQYDPELALKISRLRPGQVAAQHFLQDAMQHISDDSRYLHAMVVPQLSEAEGQHVPIRISVTEAPWRKLTGDVGYSTDSGFALAAAWVDRSLYQGNIEYSLRAEASRTSSGLGATITRPVWPAADQRVGFNADYSRVDTDGRRYDAISGGPFWQWDFGFKDYLRLSVQAENVREAGISLLTLGPRADFHFAHEHGGYLPERGWRLDAGAGLPLRVNSQGLWVTVDVSGRYFYRPADWLLLSPRAGYGRTVSLQGSAPKTYRQFAGGASSVRGYALDSLGPLGVDGLATGGLMKTYGGIDLVFMPEAETVSPVLFGDVAKMWQAIGSSSPTVWSAGAGAIIRTPAGPLRIDLAVPLKRRTQDRRFQFYITLGEVF